MKRNIVKKDMIKYLYTYPNSKYLTECLINTIQYILSQGKSLHIKNFGSFECLNKVPRKGMNFHTGKTMIINSRKSISFKASKNLKKRINRSNRI